MKNLKVALAAACAVVVGWAFTASAETVFVSPEGTTAAGGTSWADAKDLTSALAGAAEGDEIWLKQGTYDTDNTFSDLSVGARIAVPLTLKGGFAGAEGTSGVRADDAWSTFHGRDAVTNLVSIAATSGTVRLERLAIMRALEHGVISDGKAVDMEVADCRIVENGLMKNLGHAGTLYGRGLYAVGTTASKLVITNCEFAGQLSGKRHTGGYTYENGCAAFIKTYKVVKMDDTLFITNGLHTSRNGRGGTVTQGGGIYFYDAPIVANRCRFIGNSGTQHTTGSGDVFHLGNNCGGSVFSNCLFLANYQNGFNEPVESGNGAGTIQVDLATAAKTVDFVNCTFAFNRTIGKDNAGAICVGTGTVTVRDSIFWANIAPTNSSGTATTSAGDVRVRGAGGAVYFDHCLMRSKEAPWVSALTGATLQFADVICDDPLFASSTEDVLAMANKPINLPHCENKYGFEWTNDIRTIDVHLRSSGGRWLDGAWTKDAEDSPAINVGAGPVRDEPDPNGGIVNLGFYGGTAEASKTPLFKVELGEMTVTENNYTQPTFSVVMGGSGSYHVPVYLCYGLTEGSETDSTGWDHVILASSAARPGETVSSATREFFDTGDRLYYRFVVVSEGVALASKGGDAVLTANPPPFRGHGGMGVIHVREGAWGGDGSNWEFGYATLAEAVAHLSAETNEIWVMGNVPMDQDAAITREFTLRGGFSGTEDAAAERSAGTWSILDAARHNQLKVELESGTVTLDRVEICRAIQHGVYMSGGANLTMTGVRLVGNGTATGVSLNGRGLYYYGKNTRKGTLTLADCLIGGNRILETSSANIYGQNGIGAYIAKITRASMVNTVIASNGTLRTEAPHRNGFNGGALYCDDAPLTAVNCRFIGNGSCVHGSGAIIYFSGVGGHVFSNCLMTANFCNRWKNTSGAGNSGVFNCSLASKGSTVDFRNCTVAYNIGDGANSCAGIAVWKGTINVRDCIFWGNFSNTNYTPRAQNIFVRGAEGVLNVDHCLMEGAGEPYCRCATGTMTLTNMIYADPLLVSTKADFDAVTTRQNSTAIPDVKDGTYFTSDEALGSFNVHLRGGRGYTDETTGELVRVGGGDSPAIDAGSKGALLEPKPNGRRLNLGYYGGTPYATRSPDGLLLMVK